MNMPDLSTLMPPKEKLHFSYVYICFAELLKVAVVATARRIRQIQTQCSDPLTLKDLQNSISPQTNTIPVQ